MSLGRSKSKLPPLRQEYLVLIERLSAFREKILSFTNIEDGLVLQSQLLYIQRLVEREFSDQDKLAHLKYSLLHSLDSYNREVEDWSLDASPTSFNDHKKQTVDLLSKGIAHFNEVPLSHSSSVPIGDKNRTQTVNGNEKYSTFSTFPLESSSSQSSSLSSSPQSEAKVLKPSRSVSISHSDEREREKPEKEKEKEKEKGKETSGKERMKKLFFGSINTIKETSHRASILPHSFTPRFSSSSSSSSYAAESSADPEVRMKGLIEAFESEPNSITPSSSTESVALYNDSERKLGSSPSSPVLTSPKMSSPNEINYNQMFRRIKDDIDPTTRDKLEQVIREKGIGNSSVPMEKRRLIFRLMGWDDKKGSIVETEKKMKKRKKELEKGGFEKKGKSSSLTNDDIEWLLSYAQSTDPADSVLTHQALIALATSAWPIELYPGLRLRILGEYLIDKLIVMGRKGEILIHNEITWDQVETFEMLAEGASAKVFKGKFKGKEVAIKRFDVEHISFNPDDFNQEIVVTSLVQHENLCAFHGAGTKLPTPFIVAELMSKGTLAEYLAATKDSMDLKTRINF
eukprot:TRINITY_DN8992_c0_g1_i3.p1 TRINITY_DN8992_c0_g1~~TRINITY_DN8992_c0_g1_i3.p1  ORF type:complete len:572 (+),score=233.86 TRINITY_DN8992_c0_g1_i3:92-1807(+)